MFLLCVFVLYHTESLPARLDLYLPQEWFPVGSYHFHSLLGNLLQDMRVNVLDLDRENVALSGQFADLAGIGKRSVDMVVFRIDLLRRRS